MDELRKLLVYANRLRNDLGSTSNISTETPQASLPLERNLLQEAVTDAELYHRIKDLYSNGHHAQAVLEGCKFLDALVRRKSKKHTLTGVKLMTEVFSAKHPILQFNELVTESERNEQIGYMNILMGVMQGIRNPRAHDDWEDTELRALQILAFINHLVEKIRAINPPSKTPEEMKNAPE